MRARHWLVTVNNPSISCKTLWKCCQNTPELKSYAFQLEKGELGTPHIQAYFGFSKAVRLSKLEELIGDKAFHAEIASFPKAAYHYCIKEETRVDALDVYESGWVDTHPGERTDLQKAAELIASEGVQAVAEQLPTVYIKYPRGLEGLEARIRTDSPEIRKKDVLLYWGPTNTGKTTKAMSYPGASFLEYSKGFFRWTARSETAVLDEVDELIKSGLDHGTLLKLLDQWPREIPVKGGWVKFNPNRIVLTSNLPPEICFAGPHYDAIMRRITTTIDSRGPLEDQGTEVTL